MFESIGFSEMMLVAVIALIVLGPEKFPEYAKIFLRATRDLQGYIKGVREDLAKEVNPLKKEFDSLKRQDPEKLLDAMMKTGDKEGKKEEQQEQKNDGSKELVAGGGSDTPESDADSHPYEEQGTESVTDAPPEVSTEPGSGESGAAGEPAQTCDGGAPYVENQDFHYKPPERMD
jgi:sec-independent protein translocase protein TatB